MQMTAFVQGDVIIVFCTKEVDWFEGFFLFCCVGIEDMVREVFN